MAAIECARVPAARDRSRSLVRTAPPGGHGSAARCPRSDESLWPAHILDVASAGLLLANPRHRLHLMAATSEQTHDLELFQLQADQGPCLDCYATANPSRCPT